MMTKAIQNKILNLSELTLSLNRWRFQDRKVVFTNGCFDLLHMGHLDYLAKARALGDLLILGLNTDESVKRLKGASRPIKNQSERSMQLASLVFVDAVVLFEEDTPLKLIELIKPSILVKGADYQVNQIVGADVVMSYGGKVETIEFLAGYSSSQLIKDIKASI